MKLLTKLNLILLVLFVTGGLIISQGIRSFLIGNARREVLQQAELMMASAKSVRDYTSSDVGPLLEQNPQHQKRFLAETVPAFGAISTFNKLRQTYPAYTYREATLNPTNPENRATDWESDVILYLRDHPGAEASYRRARDADGSFDVPGYAYRGGPAMPGVSRQSRGGAARDDRHLWI